MNNSLNSGTEINKSEESLAKHTREENRNLKNDPLIGEVIQNYTIIELIGSGGMGKVYKAEHPLTRQAVAIKILPEQLTKQPESMKRFVNEAKAVARINHVNVVSVSNFGVYEKLGVAYLIMEYLDGNSLSKCLTKEHKLSIEQSIKIFIQICAGLSRAHEIGVVHRDIKPSNIILIEDNHANDIVKIIDFGIAKVRSIDGATMLETLTGTTETIGSPHYMSPEQCSNKTIDHRSDIYSMGCLMYQILSGEMPFNAKEFAAVLMLHMTAEPPHLVLEDEDPIIGQRLGAIIQKCLAKDPSIRYQSIDDLRGDLEIVQARLNQLRSARTNQISLLVEKTWLSFARRSRSLVSHMYGSRLTYSKLTIFSICAAIMLIVLLFTSSILSTFGSGYDMQYQPVLRKAPDVLPSKKDAAFLLDPRARLALYLDDADTERKVGDLRLALTLYDKAESKASKLDNTHREMTKCWLGKMSVAYF